MQIFKNIIERKYYYITHKAQAVKQHFFQKFVNSFTSNNLTNISYNKEGYKKITMMN